MLNKGTWNLIWWTSIVNLIFFFFFIINHVAFKSLLFSLPTWHIVGEVTYWYRFKCYRTSGMNLWMPPHSFGYERNITPAIWIYHWFIKRQIVFIETVRVRDEMQVADEVLATYFLSCSLEILISESHFQATSCSFILKISRNLTWYSKVHFSSELYGYGQNNSFAYHFLIQQILKAKVRRLVSVMQTHYKPI